MNCEVLQHNGRATGHVDGGHACGVLRDVQELIAAFPLVFRQPRAFVAENEANITSRIGEVYNGLGALHDFASDYGTLSLSLEVVYCLL